MQKYINIIKAALEEVPQEYYKLSTTYSTEGIVRERVFCYELYHRLRCIQERQEDTALNIHGEIDKRGHELFNQEDRKNPDFVFHVPGSMESNSIVVEVKGKIDSTAYQRESIEDFKTLSKFVLKYNYKLGIFIVYNYTLLEFKRYMEERIKIDLSELELQQKERIIIFCKSKENTYVEECTLIDIMER